MKTALLLLLSAMPLTAVLPTLLAEFKFATGYTFTYSSSSWAPQTYSLPVTMSFDSTRSYPQRAGTNTLTFYKVNAPVDLYNIVNPGSKTFWPYISTRVRSTGFSLCVVHQATPKGSFTGDLFDFSLNSAVMFGASANSTWNINRSIYLDFQGTGYKSHYSLWDPTPMPYGEALLSCLSFQADGQARIDQLSLDSDNWRAGLMDSAWPLVRSGNVYTAQPFDLMTIGSSSGIAVAAEFLIYAQPLTTDQVVELAVAFNQNRKYQSSSSTGPNSAPTNTGYWLPANIGVLPNPLCDYCLTRQNPRRKQDK